MTLKFPDYLLLDIDGYPSREDRVNHFCTVISSYYIILYIRKFYYFIVRLPIKEI